MKVGTKSLLFGVHQFLWHPLTVALAWRRRYARWPTFFESLAILVHDWGYWGKPDMDGEMGKLHPLRGSWVVFDLVKFFGGSRQRAQYYSWLVLGHSRWMAKNCSRAPSALCNPDKESVLFDPRWFYLLRATLSGEVNEYKSVAIRANKISPFATNREWFDWFKGRVFDRMIKGHLG